MVGDIGSPCVTPLVPVKESPYYLPARAAIISISQYVRRRSVICVTTPYSTSISKHRLRSRVLYYFLGLNKTFYITSYLIYIIC